MTPRAEVLGESAAIQAVRATVGRVLAYGVAPLRRQPIRGWLPHAEVHAIGECEPRPHVEKPRRVHPLLLEFVKKEQLMTKRDIRMLYDYNCWANARILEAASKISEEQYLAPGTFPHGGLRGTLVHALFAEWVWRLRWQGAPPKFRLEPEHFPTFASLKTRWLEEEIPLMEFVDGLTENRLTVEFDYVSTEGNPHRRVLWESMVHLVNHGTQHRSEAAVMLTDMGHSPGDIDLIVFLNDGPR